MKHALVDQLLIGLLVLGGIFVFVATVNDDTMARNKVYELKKLTSNAARAMAKHYMEEEDICQAQNISNSILSQSNLGSQLLSGNHLSYVWRDSDSDGFPNSITVTVSGYKEKTFWYKFLQLDEFVINPISATADVDVDNATYDVTMRYGGSNAGYFNMIGTYELDEDGCIQNPNILLADKRAHNIGDELGSIKMPQSRVFIIANGYSLYGNKTASINSDISIQGCNPPTAEVPNAYPNVTIDGLSNKAPTYFQNTEFNSDNGYAHMQIIPKSVHDTYVAYVNGHIDGHDHTYEQWVAYAQANNIEYQEDPNYEYIFAMEDLPNGGDKDFNDILLDTTMIAVPKELDPNVVVNDGVVTATCLQEEIEEPILNKSVKDHCNSIANGCSRCLRKNERCDEWSAYVQAQCGSDLECYDCMYSQEGCTQSIYDQFFGS